MITSIDALKTWLGEDGINYFREIKQKYGRIDAVWKEDNMIYCVHFREGMSVRNFLRGLDECKDWDTNKFDNEWVSIIEEAIKP